MKAKTLISIVDFEQVSVSREWAQPAFTYSKSTTEIPELRVKYVQI